MGSLIYQFTNAINKNTTIGLPKHSNKNNKYPKKVIIPSYAYRKNLINFACNLANYVKGFYGINKIKDIKEEHVAAFFEYKSTIGNKGEPCAHRTLVQYKSYIKKIDKCIEKAYHFKAHLYKGVPEELKGNEPIRVVAMEQEVIDEILALKCTSQAQIGVEINNLFGLRVSEIVSLKGKDFDLEKNELRIIDAKGKRNRFLSFDTDEKLELAKRIKSQFKDEDRIVPIREDSFNDFIQYSLKRIGKEQVYQEAKTGNHAIRKAAAKKELARTGDKIKTGEFLGHNDGRLVDTYCNVK